MNLKLMRPKFQKHSALKLAGRIIPRKQGYNTPQLAEELGSRACPGVYTRGGFLKASLEIAMATDITKMLITTLHPGE